MKLRTNALQFPGVPAGIIAALIAVAIVAFAAVLVHADVSPTITTGVQTSANATTTSAAIGSIVHDSVNIASTTGPTPTGTVDFNLYANTSCSGTPTTQAGVALTNGVATSSTTAVPATGLSYKVHYNGDADNVSADGSCEPLVATAANTTLSTTLSTTTAAAGTSAHDSSTLGSATANATGTVAYSLYTNNICTTGAQNAGTKTVVNAIVPDSNSILFNTAGTFYWQAVYSGDQNNSAATSSCLSEVLTIHATSTPPATGPGTISGTVYNDQNSNEVKDVSDPGLSGWTVWLHKGTQKYDSPIVATALTDANGNYSFGSLATGTYFVEEQEQAGWTQTSDDADVTLSDASSAGHLDFANIEKNNRGHDNDGDDNDGDDDNDGGHGLGHFIHDFIKSHFPNGHDNGKHLGQLKNHNKGNDNKDDDNDNDD